MAPDDDLEKAFESLPDLEKEFESLPGQSRPIAANEPQLKSVSAEVAAKPGIPTVLEDPMSTTEANLRATRQGLSLGLADEYAGLGPGFMAYLKTGDFDKAKKVYRAYQKQEESKDAEAVETNPLLKSIASFIPYMAGGPAGGGLLTSAAKGAAHFGGLAGAQAFGESQKTGTEALKDAVVPGAVGGVLGAVSGVGKSLFGRGSKLAQKAKSQAIQQAEAEGAAKVSEQAGRMGSAQADINRTLEVLIDRINDPRLSPEARAAAQKALDAHGPEALSKLVTNKATNFPGQISKYAGLEEELKTLQSLLPEERAARIQELLKTPGFIDYIKGSKLGKAAANLPVVKMLLEPTSASQKMANAKLLQYLGTGVGSAGPGPAKLSFAEWLKQQQQRQGK